MADQTVDVASRLLLLLGIVGALAIFFGLIIFLANEDPDKQRRRFTEWATPYLRPDEHIQAIFRAYLYRNNDPRLAQGLIFVVTSRSIMVQNLRFGRWPAQGEPPTNHPRNFYFGKLKPAAGLQRTAGPFTMGGIPYYVQPKFLEDVAAADAALRKMTRGK